MKKAAQTLINSLAVMIFVWATVMFALFSAAVMFCLKKAKKASKAHHSCVLAMLPQIQQQSFGYDVQPSGTGHVHRAANGMDFERVAVSEPAEDRVGASNTYSINA
jgi:cbb3-type cytochrome oxidase subunit 3